MPPRAADASAAHETEAGPAAGAPHPPLERAAWLLGLGGLIPFLAGAGLFLYGGRDVIAFETSALALAGYGATILAFLGGIRWGAALFAPRGEAGAATLAFSVLPSLAGWALLLAPAPWSSAGLAVAFLAQGLWDIAAARAGHLPPWFGRLRLVLTAGAVLSMAVAALRTF